MFVAMLFSFSIVALTQFALYYWRSVLADAAMQPVSDRVFAAAHVKNGQPSAEDFVFLAKLHSLTPDLNRTKSGLHTVNFYYHLVNLIDFVLGSQLPSIARWSDHERRICARYVAVQIDRRLHANMAFANSIRA